ncbi:MAG TPA: hypothetical protein VJ846_02830, partial [Sphingomicrobium sp.]|nr:hypothetical protein [Sphingomicrobium sp.]
MKCIAILLCSIALLAPNSALAQHEGEKQAPVRDALMVQQARAAAAKARATKLYYRPGQFNLSDLPAYVPETSINGEIRIWASDMWGNPGFQQKLEAAFRTFQPNAHFDYVTASPSGAFA